MKQKGFTLVEMMIAVVLGLLLIAAASSIFLGSKQGYRLTNGLSLMQATGRAAVDMLAEDVMLAGFPQSSGIETFVTGAGFTQDGTGNNSDMFTVRYQSATDCLNTTGGTPVYADGLQYAKNRYFIQGGNLMCESLREDNSNFAGPAVLANGVENMQILFGEDNVAADGVTNATRYVTAGNVANWDNVVSVKLGFVVNTQDVVATSDDTATFALLGQTATAATNDRMRRRAYSTTAVIRNRMQE